MSRQDLNRTFFSGDYQGCCDVAARCTFNAETKSLWFRSLVHLNRSEDARRLLKTQTALDSALLLYAETWPLREQPEKVQWILEETQDIMDREEENEEAATTLSLIFSWSGNLEEAYRLAARSPILES